jgi:hypothetical protein
LISRAVRSGNRGSVSRLVGTLPLAQMDRNWIDRWLETALTKGVKRTRLLALRPFLQWAVNPMRLIKAKAKGSTGHATWSDEQIAQFRSYHPLGSKARLALELLLNLASRRGDGISLGRQHMKEVRVESRTEIWLVYTQEKNRKRRPVKVETPIAAPLAAAIEACPSSSESL